MITEYVCEKCRSRYTTEQEAISCERNHLKTDDLMIGEAMYIYESDNFPTFVTIFTKDGWKQTYKKYFAGEGDD